MVYNILLLSLTHEFYLKVLLLNHIVILVHLLFMFVTLFFNELKLLLKCISNFIFVRQYFLL